MRRTFVVQPPFSYQPEGPNGRPLVWRLIATVLLAAMTALAWLSLIGSAPGANGGLPRAVSQQLVNLSDNFSKTRNMMEGKRNGHRPHNSPAEAS